MALCNQPGGGSALNVKDGLSEGFREQPRARRWLPAAAASSLFTSGSSARESAGQFKGPCSSLSSKSCHFGQGVPLMARKAVRTRKGAKVESFGVNATLLDLQKPLPSSAEPTKTLAYELVQGALVRWSVARDKSSPPPPTAVLLHGILGGRRNWASFAKRLAQRHPTWQFLLVDLRCHGDSTPLQKRGPHSVASAARDVLQLVGELRITPRVLIGHSFGGKVALSMVEQAAKPLPRPIRVWVLDSTPGKIRGGGGGEDHPGELIEALKQIPQVASRRAVIDMLAEQGFSMGIAQWMTTNLRQVASSNGSGPSFSWIFDLDGIADMYRSYEEHALWPIVENVPEGVHIDFLRAERSLHRWARDDVARIQAAEMVASGAGAGVQMHVLEDAGHWVHTDNPEGLFRILESSFGGPAKTLH